MNPNKLDGVFCLRLKRNDLQLSAGAEDVILLVWCQPREVGVIGCVGGRCRKEKTDKKQTGHRHFGGHSIATRDAMFAINSGNGALTVTLRPRTG